MREKVTVTEKLTIEKYKSHADRLANKPYEVVEEVCIGGINCLLNAGITEIWNLVINASTYHPDNTNAQLGVGDSDTAADAAQTDLQAAVNKDYNAMDASYPIVADQTVTFSATFGSAEANFAWNECAVRYGAAGTVFNRIVSAKGTKVDGEEWVARLAITLS